MAQSNDTLYAHFGKSIPCKIIGITESFVLAHFIDSTVLLDSGSSSISKIPKKAIDSIYLSNPNEIIPNDPPPKVGNNLIASGVLTFISGISVFVGAQLDRLEEGIIVGGLSSMVSTVALINAGVVSNSQEPPPPAIKHVIVF